MRIQTRFNEGDILWAVTEANEWTPSFRGRVTEIIITSDSIFYQLGKTRVAQANLFKSSREAKKACSIRNRRIKK